MYMKKFVNAKGISAVGYALKYIFMAAIGLSVIYSFGYVPLKTSMASKACHTEALAASQQAAQQAQQANQNLQEGDQPVQVDQIGIYNTQYTLCQRSRGL
jgi:hypothetical protein